MFRVNRFDYLVSDGEILELDGESVVLGFWPIIMQAGSKSPSRFGSNYASAVYPQHHSRKIIQGRPRSLCLPKLCESDDISSVLIVRQECPWDTYRRVATCDIAGNVIIAVRYPQSNRMKAIRQYPKCDAERLIHIFGSEKHMNILSVRECYIYGDSLYALTDNVSLTLAHVVKCEMLYPNEIELASIMSQVLHGIRFLLENRFRHRVFSCKSITLGLDGVIKIACLEDCLEGRSTESETVYIDALPSMTMQLMQKSDKEEGVVGIDDVNRWPVDSDAFGFLSAIVSTKSISSLQKNKLVLDRNDPRKLVVLARLALSNAQISCIHE